MLTLDDPPGFWERARRLLRRMLTRSHRERRPAHRERGARQLRHLQAWARWLDDGRLWAAPEQAWEVRGVYRGRPTRLLVARPGQEAGSVLLRLEVDMGGQLLARALESPPARAAVQSLLRRLDMDQAALERGRLALTLTRVRRGRLSAWLRRGGGPNDLDPRWLRDAFDGLVDLADRLPAPPAPRLLAQGPACTCPYCHDALTAGDDLVACPSCGTPHHRDCAGELGRCTVLGCAGGAWVAPRRAALPLT